jgi:hypothetical protein
MLFRHRTEENKERWGNAGKGNMWILEQELPFIEREVIRMKRS